MKVIARCLLIITAGWLAFAVATANAVVITPVGAVGDSEYDDSAGIRRAIYTINGAGLDPSPGDVLTKLHNEASTTELNGGMWMNAEGKGTTGNIIFDLGATYLLTDLHVWNQAEYAYVCCNLSSRGANEVDVYVGADSNPTTFAQKFNFAQAMQTAPSTTFAGAAQFGNDFNIPGATYTLTTPVTARYVKFDILSGHGVSQIGLSEVRFSGRLIPEPSTFALIGIALIGCGLRRRVNRVARR
jgi:hypothetical protein